MLVHVLPNGSDPFEMIAHWRVTARRKNLIPWDIARIYFVPPQVWIDDTQTPPALSDGPWQEEEQLP